ncbi:hypothetical protein K501DRAFT_330422 [Backusella circina FSU 941]|nr:hypothetical protein K501DRAFT_330422 [Backusella circina FSU 941]
MMLGNKKQKMMMMKRKGPSISSSSSVNDDEYYKRHIVDSTSHYKQQRYTHVMKLFCNSTQLEPVQNELPKTHLKPSTYLSLYSPSSNEIEQQDEITLLWSLADALLSNDLKNWLTMMLQPELNAQQPSADNLTDPWQVVFLYTSHGQIQLACDSLLQMNEPTLAALLRSHDDKNTPTAVANMTHDLKEQGKWESMSRYQQNIIYALMGHELDNTVMENLSWKSILATYLLFVQKGAYKEALNRYTSSQHNDNHCLWYQLLQWWYNNNDDLIHDWPLDLVWLLSIYQPDKFKDSDEYTLKWVDELQTMEEHEYAIYASLFLHEQREGKVRELLRMSETVNEQVLLLQYFIPVDWIHIAKALHAHDDFDFENEYKFLLQGNLEKQAKMALMLSLLPKLFNNGDESLESSLKAKILTHYF